MGGTTFAKRWSWRADVDSQTVSRTVYVTDPRTGRRYVSKRRRSFDGDRCPHELTFSCYNRFQFLNRDRTRQWFVEALQAARTKWHVDVWAYVIMPEHVHLLVAPRLPKPKIGSFAGGIKQSVARNAVAWLRVNAPEWLPRITVVEGGRTVRRF